MLWSEDRYATIFDKIEYPLSYIDDEVDISTDVEPLQLFIGFRGYYIVIS